MLPENPFTMGETSVTIDLSEGLTTFVGANGIDNKKIFPSQIDFIR